jgi:hypothetical protein
MSVVEIDHQAVDGEFVPDRGPEILVGSHRGNRPVLCGGKYPC